MIPEEIIEQAAAATFSNDSADWGFSTDWMDSADDETREIWRASARVTLETALPALREWVLETELKQVGWWNATRGMHPIQKTPDQPEHLWDCYTTDRPVFVHHQDSET